MFGVKLTIEDDKMNRQEALEWLVENVTKWPVDGETLLIELSPDGWHWLFCIATAEVVLVTNCWTGKITQADWLAATDDMPRKDCESVFE